MAVHDITNAGPELLALIEEARRGELTLVRGSEVIARLSVIPPERGQPRVLGGLKGRLQIAPDFDEWPDDIAEAFGMRDAI